MRRSFSFIAVALLIAACSKPEQEPTWSKIDLPADGKVVLRDVADCGDTWWAVGGVLSPAGSDGQAAAAARPAAWTGGPGGTWTAVRFAPLSTSYYGPKQIIRSVACADGKVAMVGAVPGGAHGNPRVSTWRLGTDGRMAENAAPFETYGGDEAVGVGPIAAGPHGFAIAGIRSSGAAAWFSPDGLTFTLSELNAAGTAADDVRARPDGGWLVTGTSADQRPAAWVVEDGQWATAASETGVREIRLDPENTPVQPVAVAERGTTLLLAGDDSLWQATVHR
ncbi:hypothetical protein Aab01nite_67290 [Paractinoplanes abujensis]|uniref:Uncharacterized protein n=1 Tax=Paractinoplanes abujensis TaxID=882441 RepID=A0A7W7CXX1_9ACTN|nr:hypothetical protein [Actinoplanes abujensis]MBB4695555.1 hypothetical protein [Actinoplanes abujensis]GID23139.1 hypothetical protein Aab01nite_67290 [Actinoplanes abujensis]